MDKINQVNLFNGLNLNPIPLEFTQGITTTEWLGAMQAKVNELVNAVNSIELDVTNKCYKKIEDVKSDLLTSLNNTNKELTEITKRVVVLENNKEDIATISNYIKNVLKPQLEKSVSDINTKVNDLNIELNKTNLNVENKYNTIMGLIDSQSVISPFDGCRKNLQGVINDFFKNYNIDTGNVNIKYAKKMFTHMGQTLVNGSYVKYSTMPFSVVALASKSKLISVDLEVFTSDGTQIMTLYLTRQHAFKYSFYALVYMFAVWLNNLDSTKTITKCSNSVTNAANSMLGFSNNKNLPLTYSKYYF